MALTEAGPEAEPEEFEGYTDRLCGEHRTCGTRAWCHDCGEWCYPGFGHHGCRGCVLGYQGYHLEVGPSMELTHVQRFPVSGTVQLTIKRKKPGPK